MTTTDTFNGAKSAFTFFYAYMNTVGQDIGIERALALDSRMCEAMGAAQGAASKEQADLDKIDLQAASSLIDSFLEPGLGITSEVVETSDGKRVLKVGRCPLYEAAAELGMDNATIETFCRAGALRFMNSVVKQWDPAFSYELLEFRSSADEPCTEALLLS
jgi:hypothetical protein